jgi:hypothetical protein
MVCFQLWCGKLLVRAFRYARGRFGKLPMRLPYSLPTKVSCIRVNSPSGCLEVQVHVDLRSGAMPSAAQSQSDICISGLAGFDDFTQSPATRLWFKVA